MITAFDRITIHVPHLADALSQYRMLLGRQDVEGVFSLGNIEIKLTPDPARDHAAITGLSLLDASLQRGEEAEIEFESRKLGLTRSHHRDGRYREEDTATGVYAIDHLVLQSRDADDCIRLFERDLGLRLALDKAVPEWGGRMLFFRMGKMTLEVIQHLTKPPQQDAFWGITYLCRDLQITLGRLDSAGIAHSDMRKGRKPGTRVATVKSHCLGLPTLLIGPG